MTESLPDQLIALGANLASTAGLPAETLVLAITELAKRGIVIRAVSRFYVTPCFPAGAGPDFVNAALRVRSDLTPPQMLALLHEVEAKFGRVRIERWAGRSLDLDLIATGDLVEPDQQTVEHWMHLPPDQQAQVAPDQLLLPHPRLQDRGFVLVPLADVAPDWRHPLLQKTVRELLADLPAAETASIRPL